MNKNMITILIAILAGLFLITMSIDEILVMVLSLPALILAITVHEFAHAKTAELLGDPTPRNQGRVTLNPLKHVSLMGLVSLFFLRIGWGKPVIINPSKFIKIKNKKIGEALVSLAGPLVNIIVSFLLIFCYALLLKYNVRLGTGNIEVIIHSIIWSAISINLGLAIFNLLPIPPLDGFSIFSLILPRKVSLWIESNQFIISIIFLVLIWSGVLSKITLPFLTYIMNGMLKLVSLII